jgi:hypothetical protein
MGTKTRLSKENNKNENEIVPIASEQHVAETRFTQNYEHAARNFQ